MDITMEVYVDAVMLNEATRANRFDGKAVYAGVLSGAWWKGDDIPHRRQGVATIDDEKNFHGRLITVTSNINFI